MEMNMHDSTLDLFDKVGIAHDDIEALATSSVPVIILVQID